MARFYGFQPDQINEMTFEDFLGYLKAIKVVRSLEKLDEVKVTSYPHMKQGFRDRIHKDWHKEAFAELHKHPVNVVTLDDVAKRMGMKQHGG